MVEFGTCLKVALKLRPEASNMRPFIRNNQMSLWIDIRDPNWMREEELYDLLAPHLPGVTIHTGEPQGNHEDVTMLAAIKLHPGVASKFPNLQLVQKLGAGVDTMVRDPDLPAQVRITRLKPDGPAREIAEYCLAYVLRNQRHLQQYETDSSAARWQPVAPRESPKTTIGVLGLGHIGARTARTFAALDFRVIGWSRSEKTIGGVDCRWGDEALPGLLGECDYVASILPSTDKTRDLFDAQLLSSMKPNAVLINAGRGDLIVEDDLITALQQGHLSGAVLDVFKQEPLPPEHPFWQHPKITVTPHVSGWHLDGGLLDIAENYKRLCGGQPLINEIDRSAGY
jgi:glyoxylate/hydroxypyruvate reductase A